MKKTSVANTFSAITMAGIAMTASASFADTIHTFPANVVPVGPLVSDGLGGIYSFYQDPSNSNIVTMAHMSPSDIGGQWEIDRSLDLKFGQKGPVYVSSAIKLARQGQNLVVVLSNPESQLGPYTDTLVSVDFTGKPQANVIARINEPCAENDCYDDMTTPGVLALYPTGIGFVYSYLKTRPSDNPRAINFNAVDGQWVPTVLDNGEGKTAHYFYGADAQGSHYYYSYEYFSGPNRQKPVADFELGKQFLDAQGQIKRQIFAAMPFNINNEGFPSVNLIGHETFLLKSHDVKARKEVVLTGSSITQLSNNTSLEKKLFTRSGLNQNYFFVGGQVNQDVSYLVGLDRYDTSTTTQIAELKTPKGWQPAVATPKPSMAYPASSGYPLIKAWALVSNVLFSYSQKPAGNWAINESPIVPKPTSANVAIPGLQQ